MTLRTRLLSVGPSDPRTSLGMLLLRLGFGGFMIVRHGWGKLSSYADKKDSFPDPLGVGSELSLALACFGEVVAPLLLILGLGTRLASIPAAFTMAVAAFVVHAGDPLAKKEMALIYLVAFVAIGIVGPGRWSLDKALGGR